MKLIRFFLLLVIYIGANYYVFSHFYNLVPIRYTVIFILLVVLSIFISFSILPVLIIPKKLTIKSITFLYTLGTSWIFILIYAILIFGILDLVTYYLYPIPLWMNVGFALICLFSIFYYGNINYKKKKRVELNIAINKPLKKNIKIVAISDLHLGYTINIKELNEWIQLINQEKADILLIPGDIIDNNVNPLYFYQLAPYFNKFHAPLGIYACLGNHEYISGIDSSIKFLEKTNVHLLRDSYVDIEGVFYLIGRDDKTNSRRKALKEIIKNIDSSHPIILLDHQPYGLEESQKNGIDIQLSGHTHRGQVWPISWITDKLYEVSHGYKKKGNTNIYVSSGIGIWGGKFRIGTQSEYVVINLSSI